MGCCLAGGVVDSVMKIVDDLKSKVDDKSADTLFEAYQGAIQRVVLAPYKCMMLSVVSCLLLGFRYKKFIRFATVACLGFIAVMSVCFITLRSISYLWYAVGGLLTLSYIITFIHKDIKHLEILKEVSLMTEGGDAPESVPDDLELEEDGVISENSVEKSVSFPKDQFQSIAQSEAKLKSTLSNGIQRVKLNMQQVSDEEDLDDMDSLDDELN